jgi:NitT/TauT family transport system substrate-binding protein
MDFLRRAMKPAWGVLALAAFMSFAVTPVHAQQNPTLIRVGYFPNLTHAQALVGRANGQFEQALGPGVHLDWKAFNAGPSAIEALFAKALDMAYVGPNPAVTGYIRSEGVALRVIAGAASGGAALVVRQGAGIQQVSDFHGKRVASPQLGNTQDVALRAWLRASNLLPRDKGGDVQVLPTSNPDQLTLFLTGPLDAAWAPEPWAARLVHEGGGRVFLDERDLWPNREFVAAEIIVSTAFLKNHPDLVKKFLRIHVELTEWINKNPVQAKQVLNQQLQKETGKPLPPEELNDAFSRIEVTYDPIRSALLKSSQQAFDQGFLGRTPPDLSGLFDLTLLNEILQEKKARLVQ